MEVATPNPVPTTCCRAPFRGSLPDAERLSMLVVSENIGPGFEEEMIWGVCCGSMRSTGRVALEDRRTHFHSSLINAPPGAVKGETSIELRTLARLMRRSVSEPARIAICRRIAG